MQPTMMVQPPQQDFEYRMKRWWSWTLYALAIYATGYLILCNILVARSAGQPIGFLGTAVAVQLATGIPAGMLPFAPFLTSALACVALVCLYRLSGRTFPRSTKLYGWANPILSIVLLVAFLFSIDKPAEKSNVPGLPNVPSAKVDYLAKVRAQFFAGMDYGQVMEVIRAFDGVEMLTEESQKIVDAATGKPALRVPIVVKRFGSFDLIVEQESQTVLRTEDPVR